MIAISGMLVGPAENAGIKVPKNVEDYDKNEYPYWYVYTTMQLGRRMSNPSSHWSNAKIIVSIPEDKIKVIELGEVLAMGYD